MSGESLLPSQSTSSSSSRSSESLSARLGSLVWLTGARCTPTRLPLAVVLTFRRLLLRLRMASNTPPRSEDLILLLLLFGGAAGVYLSLAVAQYMLADTLTAPDRHWLLSLAMNLLGYSTIFLPGYLAIRYVRQTGYVENGSGQKCLEPAVRLCVYGSEVTLDDTIAQEEEAAKSAKSASSGADAPKSDLRQMITLGTCFVGLQVSYLTWGLLQEKIMTKSYENSAGERGRFKDSQFLVFVNRILAFALALLYITFSRQPRHRAPLYKYSYCSLSNIMSSWFQYEALKYVSFPTQVLAKASKIIPVMAMGKVVSNRKYEFYEYVVAILISLGMVLFLFGTKEDRTGASSVTTFSGFLLLIGYMASDSFTSNWQNELFSQHKMSSVQMMCGVNLFSCLLTSASLLQQGGFYQSLLFMSQFPTFALDCVVLSLCSAIGQLFIYYTISQFGAVVFIIIMTLRQAMAILLSCIVYHHAVSASGVIGICVVFGAMFLKIYCGHRLHKKNKAKPKLLPGAGAAAAATIEKADEKATAK